MRLNVQKITFFFITLCYLLPACATDPALTTVRFVPLPEQKVRVSLRFNQALPHPPRSFITQKPARLIIDFPGVGNRLAGASQRLIDLAALHSMTAVATEDRMRLILSLNEIVKYRVHVSGKRAMITFFAGKKRPQSRHYQPLAKHQPPEKFTPHFLRNIDFRGMPDRSGKLILRLSDANMGINIKQSGQNLVLDLLQAGIKPHLAKRFDVQDFGSPVTLLDVTRHPKHVTLTMHMKGAYQYYAYQIDRKYIVEVHPMTAAQKEAQRLRDPIFTGKKISLNFQNIKVRSILQLLAEFTGLNIVVSDSVQGTMTLRLNRVPWDQALYIILKTRGLAKRQIGSTLIIAPTAEIAAQETAELKASKEVNQLAPLHSELLQISYAAAESIAKLLKDKANSLLSERGHVSVDKRTNTLWILDTTEKLHEIRNLVHKLDIPVKQVLIEARIVLANKDFERELGVRFGVTRAKELSGTVAGANQLQQNVAPADVPIPSTINVGRQSDRLNVDLPAEAIDGANVGSIGLALAKLGKDVLLDLELSALESEGKGEVISSPRVITADQHEARIEQGDEIPYEEATSSGATAVAFKEAVLSLSVTPHITPDHKVILDLQVNKDQVDETRLFRGVPSIKTRQIQTQVLVDNGQTVVLGGIYTQDKRYNYQRIPFLGNIPVLGLLFRTKNSLNRREELLIFVTPRIVYNKERG